MAAVNRLAALHGIKIELKNKENERNFQVHILMDIMFAVITEEHQQDESSRRAGERTRIAFVLLLGVHVANTTRYGKRNLDRRMTHYAFYKCMLISMREGVHFSIIILLIHKITDKFDRVSLHIMVSSNRREEVFRSLVVKHFPL